MKKERKHYDSLFKENAVKLSYERKNVSGLVRELGVISALLYRWREEYDQYGKGSFPGNGIIKQTPEEKELNEMKKRMRDIEMENDILKKRWASFPRVIVDLWIYQEAL